MNKNSHDKELAKWIGKRLKKGILSDFPLIENLVKLKKELENK